VVDGTRSRSSVEPPGVAAVGRGSSLDGPHGRGRRLLRGFTGTGHLVRLALRRDRMLLPTWIAALVGMLALVVSTLTALYATEADRAFAAAFSAASPVARLFDGPASGTELGAMVMVEAYGVLAILVALMSAQTVVRHTRQDEETGRAELLGSTVVGHHARLSAALIVVALANLVLAVGVAAMLVSYGLEVGGSVVGGAAVAAVGLAFAAVAAVTAQLAQTQRTANGLAGAALGVAFLLRAVGDVRGRVAPSEVELISAWPSWLSPIGWGQQVRPFHQDNLEVFGLFAAFVIVLVAVAFVLTEHRDLGAGMLAERRGPAEGSPRLATPLGLAWRLHRGSLLWWTIGMTAVTLAFGTIGDTANEFLTTNEQLQQALEALGAEGSLEDLFFAFMMGLVGVASTGFTVQTLLRARGEEVGGRLEPVLAAAVSRSRWLAGHVAIAAVGTAFILLMAGAGAALSYGAVTGELAASFRGLVGSALVQLPAALALGGFVVAAIAILPTWAAALGWGALAISLVLGQLGAILDLPPVVLDLSPFTHVPLIPAEEMAWLPVAVLLGVAVGFTALGAVVFRRRDLAIGA
jgi:ABC-2 type transport system permease protein